MYSNAVKLKDIHLGTINASLNSRKWNCISDISGEGMVILVSERKRMRP